MREREEGDGEQKQDVFDGAGAVDHDRAAGVEPQWCSTAATMPNNLPRVHVHTRGPPRVQTTQGLQWCGRCHCIVGGDSCKRACGSRDPTQPYLKGTLRDAVNARPEAVSAVCEALAAGGDPGDPAEFSSDGLLIPPLLWAASLGHAAVVEVMLRTGADAELIDESSGNTALMEACRRGHVRAIRVLIGYGATPAATNDRRKGAKDFALKISSKGEREPVLQALAGMGAAKKRGRLTAEGLRRMSVETRPEAAASSAAAATAGGRRGEQKDIDEESEDEELWCGECGHLDGSIFCLRTCQDKSSS